MIESRDKQSIRAARKLLADLGVEGWADPKYVGTSDFKWIPLAKMETSHARCMAQRMRTRLEAKASGAEPCTIHSGEFVGDCPMCLGLWQPDRIYPPAPLTKVEFEAMKSEALSSPKDNV